MRDRPGLKNLAELVEWLWPTRPEYRPNPVRRLWLLTVYTLRRWFNDGCPALASSLSLQTLLSVVPLAGVLLSVLRVVDPELGRQFLERVATTLSPTGAQRTRQFTDVLFDLGENISVASLGIWGLLLVFILAYFLFATLERTFNRIWGNTRRRRAVAKFTTFYTLATLFPLVMFYSLAQPMFAPLNKAFSVAPVIVTGIGLVLINRLMPRQTVSWSAAMLGGLGSAVLFELTKFGFGKYLGLVAMQTYEGIYGSLAILPVFVIWSYVSWMIVLLGAEVTFVAHNASAVAREGYVHPRHQRNDRPHATPARAAARLLLAICDQFDQRGQGLTPEVLDQRFGLGLTRTARLLDELEAAEFITPVAHEDGGWVPGRTLDQIYVCEVLAIFDSEPEGQRDDELTQLFGEIDAFGQERVGKLTFMDLVVGERKRRASTAAPHESLPGMTTEAVSEGGLPPRDEVGDA